MCNVVHYSFFVLLYWALQKLNHVQPKDTQIKLMVNHIAETTRGNYNMKKGNRITVSSRILNHNNMYT
jgi:hypothetical protein